ncbi:MAG: cell division protein FtsL [Roseburia sp.]|nr:cell division protein FtsL [Roseburia sp.]
MAQTRRVRTTATNRIDNRRNAYVYGSAVRKPDVQTQLQEEPRRRLSHEARKNRDRAHHMSLGYVVFLASALCAAGVVLISYIQLQSELTNKIKTISRLESQLNTMRLTNDEEYHRIVNSVDLEEIKRIAIGELGMTYAKEGQIINYRNAGSDYMRKSADN